MKRLLFILLLSPALAFGQSGSYAPPAGTPGTTAMHKDSSAFVAWATGAVGDPGPQNISVAGSPLANTGTPASTLGAPGVNGVYSLGDGGSVILTFDGYIKNGPGPDLAVFENSFDGLFLELAFVQVSSDGLVYYSFPTVTEVQTDTQTCAFCNTDATQLYNFAGKYRSMWGTPFDLDDLVGIAPQLNVDSVTHVRIVDVVGSINPSLGSTDYQGTMVNDPWPTDFPSSGFDCDAVGAINFVSTVGVPEYTNVEIEIFPNPGVGDVQISSPAHLNYVRVYDMTGALLLETRPEPTVITLATRTLTPGSYLIQVQTEQGVARKTWVKMR